MADLRDYFVDAIKYRYQVSGLPIDAVSDDVIDRVWMGALRGAAEEIQQIGGSEPSIDKTPLPMPEDFWPEFVVVARDGHNGHAVSMVMDQKRFDGFVSEEFINSLRQRVWHQKELARLGIGWADAVARNGPDTGERS